MHDSYSNPRRLGLNAAGAIDGGRVARILVVDSDDSVARAVARLLRLRGHEVVTVEGGAATSSTAGQFALAILDCRLSDVAGTRVAETLLASRRVSATVFFCSRSLLTDLGPVVMKPDVMGLMALVDELLIHP
ncbi:MAG: hypothetical protein R3B13_01825 [Polyangiaceae bacterium]